MDLSYFEEPVEVLVAEEVGHVDEATLDWVVDSPAVYETQQQTRRRPQSVSHSDLLRIIGKQINGTKLDHKIALQQETGQWDWFDQYHDHLARVEEVEAWNLLFAGVFQDELGVDFAVGQRELPVAPVRPPIISPEQWRLNNYTTLRQASYGSWQKQMETLYDDQKNGTTSFKDGIDAVKLKHGKPS
jgi:hypothetical protein